MFPAFITPLQMLWKFEPDPSSTSHDVFVGMRLQQLPQDTMLHFELSDSLDDQLWIFKGGNRIESFITKNCDVDIAQFELERKAVDEAGCPK